jgi:hypothetical protein
VDTQGEHPVHWQVRLGRTRLSNLMNAAAGLLPEALWRSDAPLRVRSSYLVPFNETRHDSATSRGTGRSERCMACA